MKFMVITKILDCASCMERNDVTIGKPYKIWERADGRKYFIDDSGDENYGADPENTVYKFDVYKKVKCKC